jgi:hypothetical protein
MKVPICGPIATGNQISAASCDRLHVTQICLKQVYAWEQRRGPIRPVIRSELIALACAGKACGLSRFGYPICARPHLWKKPTGNHSLSPEVLTPGRIRILSMRSPTGLECEAGRDLDCCWWQELLRWKAGLIDQKSRFESLAGSIERCRCYICLENAFCAINAIH